MTGMVVRIPSKKRKNKGVYLENDPFIDWQPVKCFKQWSNVFMSAPAKTNLHCVVLNLLQPVHI